MRASWSLPLVLLAGCTLGAPPGFSSGSSWSFPLVTPLEGGPILVPVTIQGKGPFLFRLDPDAPFSVLDSALASELELRTSSGPEFVDETDRGRNMMLAEVHHIKLGTLSIDASRTWFISGVGAFNVGGHQVRGVLGRDVIADSLVLGFDRQQGMGWITTQKGFTKPEGASLITTRKQRSRINTGIRAVSRRLTHAIIAGEKRTVHVDLGDTPTFLREELWSGLTPIDVKRTLVDETGTRREVSKAAVASTVEIGGATAQNVVILPYVDERWEATEYDGAVGLGVFEGLQVWANWDNGNIYLSPEKTTDAKTRIARWTSAELDACSVPACTTASVLVPEAVEGQPLGRPVLAISRTQEVAGLGFEVMLGSSNPDLPKFVAIFPEGETDVSISVDEELAGATLEVLDVSPFPRACRGAGACIYQLADPQ